MLLLKYLQLMGTFGWPVQSGGAAAAVDVRVPRPDELAQLPFQAPPALVGVHDGQLPLSLGGS